MEEDYEVEDWTKEIESYMEKEDYKFVIYLLDNEDNFYKDLKFHSLCHNGYVSQIVKFKSLKKMQ